MRAAIVFRPLTQDYCGRLLCDAAECGYPSVEPELPVAHRANITRRPAAVTVIAAACVSDARIAHSTLILAVSLVLLPGAVWMHAT